MIISTNTPRSSLLLLISIPLFLLFRRLFLRRRRTLALSPNNERVLVIGASSGVGKEIAIQYARRGACVCVVGRRSEMVEGVVGLCRELRDAAIKDKEKEKEKEKDEDEDGDSAVIGLTADFAVPEDMIRVRDTIRQAWHGLDTVIVSAGVSALKPILALAGIETQIIIKGTRTQVNLNPVQVSASEIQAAVDISHAGMRGNFDGPLVTALTFIPFLTETSSSPAIQLISTAAAIIPAPTRGLYGSTKASSLLLYQSLSIEHPNITFSFILPGTIQGDFRASAVDNGPIREKDPNKHGLDPKDVARRCIDAVDYSGGKRRKLVVFPFLMRVGQFVYWFVSEGFVERLAKRKYRYPQ